MNYKRFSLEKNDAIEREKFNIRVGRFNEDKVVHWFGTNTHIKYYENHNSLSEKYRSDIIKRANKYCKITRLSTKSKNGNPTYWIKELYDVPLPDGYNKMHSGLYQYIIPSVLKFLLRNNHNECNKLDFINYYFVKDISMVNHNYGILKYEGKNISEKYLIPYDIVKKYDKYMKNKIKYYIEKSLRYLQNIGCISIEHSYKVEKVINKQITLHNKKIETNAVVLKSEATKEDIEIYNKCLQTVDDMFNIKNKKDRFFSKQSSSYKKQLQDELEKYFILSVFDNYRIYYIDYDYCSKVLRQYDISQKNGTTLISLFNKEFSSQMVNKFKQLYKDNKDEFKMYKRRGDLIDDIKKLNSMFIDFNAKKINSNSK